MGLSSRLHNVSNNSIPILLVLAAAEWVSYLRSLLLCVLHSLGLLRLHPPVAEKDAFFSAVRLHPPIRSGLVELIVIASSSYPFAYEALRSPSPTAKVGEEKLGCMACLCPLADGDRM